MPVCMHRHVGMHVRTHAFMCTCLCMSVCVIVSVLVFLSASLSVSARVRVCVCAHVYLCVWVHFPAMCDLHVDARVTCMFMHICMCRKVFMCVYTCRRMFPFIHAYAYSCASTRVNVYFFVDLLENAYLSAHV